IIMLAILTAARGDVKVLKTLTLDLREYLIKGLMDIQAFVNKAIEVGKTGEKALNATIYIQQAIVSLKEDDFDTLFEAYKGALELIQGNSELIDEEIEDVIAFADIIYNAFEQGTMQSLSRTTTSLMI